MKGGRCTSGSGAFLHERLCLQGEESRPLRPSALVSVGRAALVELLELRQENGLLHARLHEVARHREGGPPASAHSYTQCRTVAAKMATLYANTSGPPAAARPYTVAGLPHRPLTALRRTADCPAVACTRGSPALPAPGTVAGSLAAQRAALLPTRRAATVGTATGGRRKAGPSGGPPLDSGRFGAHLEYGPTLLSTTGRMLGQM